MISLCFFICISFCAESSSTNKHPLKTQRRVPALWWTDRGL